MENFNAEPKHSDEESADDSKPVRRAPVPATALHGVVGVSHETPKPREPIRPPRFEALFAGEQHERRQAVSLAERAKHDGEDDDDSTAKKAARTTLPLPGPATPTLPELDDLHKLSFPETAAVKSSETREADDAQEIGLNEVDKAFHDIVEVSLHDLQGLPPHETEPRALDPLVGELAAQEPVYEEAAASAPRAVPASEARVTNEVTNESDEREAASPPPTPESGYMPASETPDERPPESAPGTPGGNSPPPPPGPRPEMAGMPEPEPTPDSNPPMTHNMYRPGFAANVMPGFAASYGHGMSPAERSYVESRLATAEAASRRGDMITGLVAGWALIRTFRNRAMIKRNAKETKKQFAAQQEAANNLARQNNQLRERLGRAERQTQFQQPVNPNRFRPAAFEVAAGPATAQSETVARQQAVAAEAAATAAEKVRLIHEQQEEALRRQTLEVPSDHEVVRSQWHSIEVDKKTGKAVEQPTGFAYGEAFQQERRSEQLQDKPQDNGASGQGAGLFSAQARTPAGMYGPMPAGLPPAATPQQPAAQSTASEPSRRKSVSRQITSAAVNPWFWAAIIFLLIVFFTAAWF